MEWIDPIARLVVGVVVAVLILALISFPVVFVVNVAIGMRDAERAYRRRGHRCLACGYALRGNQSGRCPECGEPTLAGGPIAADDTADRPTEQRLAASDRLDVMPTADAVALMNAQDAVAVAAVAAERAHVVAAIELVVAAFRAGGRLVYVGAGTSGRLGVLDASECPPTFRTDPGTVRAIIAGGAGAVFRAAEGAEDDAAAGAAAVDDAGDDRRGDDGGAGPDGAGDGGPSDGNRGAGDVSRRADGTGPGAAGGGRANHGGAGDGGAGPGLAVGPADVVFGIAAGGTTPFVWAALRRARERGARTVFLACVPPVAGEPPVDVRITPLTGPEVLAGSTRLKAGTATKLVLNQITTLAMVRLGKTYGNRMVDLRASNAKLRDRGARLVADLTGLPPADAAAALATADGHVKLAVVMRRLGLTAADAQGRLDAAGGRLRDVIG